MRGILIGALVLGACGDDDAAAPAANCADASAPVVDASAPDTAPPPLTAPLLTQLRAGGTVELLGVTTGATPYVVYNVHTPANGIDTWSLEVVPVTGGTPTVLDPGLSDNDSAVVSGGGVGWYKKVDNLFLAPSVSFWTAASGPKTLKTSAFVGTFAASEDGATVAFGARASQGGQKMDIVVTSAAAPSLDNPALTGANAVNLVDVSPECLPRLVFGETTAYAAYCTGTTEIGNSQKLFTARLGAPGVQRLAKLPAGMDLIDSLVPIPGGKKVYLHAIDDTSGGAEGILLFFDDDNTTTVDLGPIDIGFPSPDGATLYAGTAGTLSSYSLEPKPVVTPLGPKNVLVLYGLSKDAKTLVYATKVGVVFGASDLMLFDVGTKHSTTIHADFDAVAAGFSGDATRVIYFDGVKSAFSTASGYQGTLKSFLIAGSTSTTLGTEASDVAVSPEGSAIISFTHESDPVLTIARQTLAWVDSARPESTAPIGTILRGRQSVWSHKTFIYEDLGDLPGIYAVEVP